MTFPGSENKTTDTIPKHLLSSYDYHLPKELIAQEPAKPRDSSRLLVKNLENDNISHLKFTDIENLLEPDDILVLNDTKVIPARVNCHKTTGGRVELLFLNAGESEPLEALVKGRVREGSVIIPDGISISKNFRKQKTLEKSGNCEEIPNSIHKKFGNVRIRLEKHITEGRYQVLVKGVGKIQDFLEYIGEMPTPPYIKKKLEKRTNYQTVYAEKSGSVAAPTAGLHFTQELLERLKIKGVKIKTVTLHVSIGTFLPVREKDIRKHRMEPEYFMLNGNMADILRSGRRVIPVGTTVVKTLESAYSHEGKDLRTEGWSNLFIYPEHVFKAPLKGMLTNFHLPASTLIMLVSAYAGRERILSLYREAVRERYRFYSFGDSMFLKGKPVKSI